MWKSEAETIDKYIPDILDYSTALYIGASGMRQHYMPELKAAGYLVDLLEVWKYNFDLLSEKNVTVDFSGEKIKFFNKFILGDVRECDKLVEDTYDIALWLQGPEHVKKEELSGTFDKLLNLVTKFVVVTCPWGVYPQGEYGGNPFETHQASLYPEDFDELGWECQPVGEEDHKRAYIMAWRRV